MKDLLVELLNATLVKRPLNEEIFPGASETEWQRCFDMALEQNVLAMTFPTMTSLPKEHRPSFVLWSKWIAYAQSVAGQSQYKRHVVEKIGGWLTENGLSTMILKGFSLSALYPNPNMREFSDIDIFSGKNYDAVNACFAKHGVNVDSVDGHHAYLKVEGVSVEHHYAFTNTKVKRGLERPEDALQRLALKDQQKTAVPGINFPNSVFTVIEVGNHAYGHFLQEKIQLRHVIDWALALRQLSEQEAKTLSELKKNTGWGEFCDTLTAIAIHQLGLSQEWFLQTELEVSKTITPVQEQKAWNDIIATAQTPKSSNSILRRLSIGKRILKNSWKYKAYANISALETLRKDVGGHFKSKVKRPQI